MGKLLEDLQSALNKVYDGNTLNIEDDRISHVDIYKCDCDAEVPLEEWNEEYKMCRDCYGEMMVDHGHKWGAL